jgi:pSer/pThr/pTyr-binding forkhead associated (FHA) protein
MGGFPSPAVAPAAVGAAPPPAAMTVSLPAAKTKVRDDPTAPARVVVTADGSAGKRYALAGEMTIGRENVDILLEDEQASRRHARVIVSAGGVELADIGSANGTFVNDKRLEGTVVLQAGDVVTVGTTKLRVDIPPPRGAAPDGATVVR